MLTVLVHYQYAVRFAEVTGFTQFSGETFGLINSFFRIRKAFAELIGKEFRPVQDMKKIARHDASPKHPREE
jgi:hypothetical protein